MSNTSASTNPTETPRSITLLVFHSHAFQGSELPGNPRKFQFANAAELERYIALEVPLLERAELVDSDTGREIDRINIFKMNEDKHLELQPIEQNAEKPKEWVPVLTEIPTRNGNN